MSISSFCYKLPIILGSSWLKKHNPHIDWVKQEITGWADKCSSSCLLDATNRSITSKVFKETYPDFSKVPDEYHALKDVFNKVKATSLPPHRPYDCPIDLLPGTMPPRVRLFSLSLPEN